MDIGIVVYWLLAFTIIVSFLGGLTYFIHRQNSTDKSQLDTMSQQQQGRRNSTNNRRKNARNAQKKKQQQTLNTTSNNSGITEDEEQQNNIFPDTTTDKDDDEQQSDEEQDEKDKFHDPIKTEQILSPPAHVEDQQKPTASFKQPAKNKTINESPSLPRPKEEITVPSKPQACVAPVKQTSSSPMVNNFKSSQNQHDNNNPKSNGHLSSSYNMYTFSGYNPLPPRFQNQRQQKEATSAAPKYRRRRGPLPPKRSSLPPGSAARSNDFVPLSIREQQQQEINDDQTESCINHAEQQQPSHNNGYSSESDILTDSPSTGGNHSVSPLLSTSAGSQCSLRTLDLVRSLSTSHGLLDELISIFDSISFSSDELELLLSKIATKHISDKHDLQRFITSAKNDKTFERIIEETYRSQAKILAIELQTEKNRVLELTKSNADMENTIRQFQQQQPHSMAQYQQMILPYQMQLRRLGDENNRLQHQLHAYSMMPATLNELKQQQHILNEQIRQLTMKNGALENEVADSERASKHAAEIYKKADAQKQERIEQMIADINKYKKLDKELTALRQKYNELEKDFNSKINEITQQRNELQAQCDQLKEKVQKYEKSKIKSDQPREQLEQELDDLKTKNDQLRQCNWKIMEDLNKLLQDQKLNQNITSS